MKALMALGALALFMAPPAQAQSSDTLTWARAKTCADYLAFAGLYPNSKYTTQAKARIVEMKCVGAAAAKPAPLAKPTSPARNPTAQVPAATTPATSVASAPKEFRDCSDCPQMVRVPGGTFQMGDVVVSANSKAKPVHTVTLGPFAIGKYEVTRGQYAAFVRASGRPTSGNCYAGPDGAQNPSATWQSPGFAQTDRDPVSCVSWEDAKAYAAWLSQKTGHRYRLLSESEWEYAARAGSAGQYYWGEDEKAYCSYANAMQSPSGCNDGALYTAPVGSYRANAFGIHDMSGNVSEWVEDCIDDLSYNYSRHPRDGSAYVLSGCISRVHRGGGWSDYSYGLWVASRDYLFNGMLAARIGFRIARAL